MMSIRATCLKEMRSILGLAPRSALLFLLSSSIIQLSTVDAHAQATYVQGLPTIGKSNTTAVPGQMIIDAVQFLNLLTAPDMCAAIAAACSKLSATSTTYPAGATIDARGFTGNQVCGANNITTMLNGCCRNIPAPALLAGSCYSARSTCTPMARAAETILTAPAPGRARLRS